MDLRLGRTLGVAAGAVLLVPAAADAATKTVFMGAPPPPLSTKAQIGAFEKAMGEADDFFPRTTTIRAGDTVSFEPMGFHTVDIPAPRSRPLAFLTPSGKQAGTVLDAAGVPFWFSNAVPLIGFNERLLAQGFGKLKVKGAAAVRSGLPLSEKVKPMRVRFPRAGSFKYYCNIHPGMDATIRVLGKAKRAPSNGAHTRTIKLQLASAAANAKKLPNAAGVPANTISVSQQKGGVHHLGFVPSKLTVAPGTTVTFAMPSNSRDVHTATFGPGDPNKDPKKEPNNYLAGLAATFQGPGPFDAISTYPSEAPNAPAAALSPALHGNGFWNSGVLGPPVTQLPRNGKVTFTTPGAYKFYCLIHPFMTGTITVQ
jgi:plastocyanin